MKMVAIILARGGSKGISNKNIIDFCGKPLLVWTIEHCFAGGIDLVYVSSDSKLILNTGEKYGAKLIKRPKEISGDEASSESGWLHALDIIENKIGNIDWVFAPQVTSPLRSKDDVYNGVKLANSGNYDSLFSCSISDDLFFWEYRSNGIVSVNYDWKDRKRRQDISNKYIENGSFYLFRPDIIRKNKNRFGGRIGHVEMDFWKMFEIDSMDDLRMCSALMKEFILESD
tara:strand:- start:4630 stop:5316 length:687 start_codon:yes stop_codon:yes gene_type:complete